MAGNAKGMNGAKMRIYPELRHLSPCRPRPASSSSSGRKNEEDERQRDHDHHAEDQDIGEITPGKTEVALPNAARCQRACGDHQADIERGAEEQDRCRKSHRGGQRTVAQLCDVEQIDKIDDEHREQADARGQCHHRDMTYGFSAEKYGLLGRNRDCPESGFWPELAICVSRILPYSVLPCGQSITRIRRAILENRFMHSLTMAKSHACRDIAIRLWLFASATDQWGADMGEEQVVISNAGMWHPILNDDIQGPRKAEHAFARVALSCIHRQYPNKISHVMNSAEDVAEPNRLTPVFYGCFDWHSAVHGHWLLVRLWGQDLVSEMDDEIVAALATNFTPARIAGEIGYFNVEGTGILRTALWSRLVSPADGGTSGDCGGFGRQSRAGTILARRIATTGRDCRAADSGLDPETGLSDPAGDS